MIDILGASLQATANGCTTHRVELPKPFARRGLDAVQFDSFAPQATALVDVPAGATRLAVVLDGMLTYSDSLGRKDEVLGGEVLLVETDAPLQQRLHNLSGSDTVELVSLHGGGAAASRCVQRYFSDDARRNHLCTVLSPDTGGDSLRANGPLAVSVASVAAGGSVVVPTPAGHYAIVCAMSNAVVIEGQALQHAELALVTTEVPDLRITCQEPAEILVALAGPTTE